MDLVILAISVSAVVCHRRSMGVVAHKRFEECGSGAKSYLSGMGRRESIYRGFRTYYRPQEHVTASLKSFALICVVYVRMNLLDNVELYALIFALPLCTFCQ